MSLKRIFCASASILLLAVVMTASSNATAVTVTITADDQYDLYVNGAFVGSGNHWESPETWVVEMAPGIGAIAVFAYDMAAASGSGIGLIANIAVDGGHSYVTDTSWKVAEVGPAGWSDVTFDDSAWSPPLDEGAYDTIPWTRYAPPITDFASTGARWLWRGTPPYLSGYGYYNLGGYQNCYFRKTITVDETTPAAAPSWGSLKAKYR